MDKIKKGILISYKDVNIFQIYFFIEKKIKQVQDITFVKKYEDSILPYVSVNRLLPKESLDFVISDKSMMPNVSANLTNLNYHILLLSIYQLSPVVSNISFTLSKPLDEIKQSCQSQYKQ